MEKKIKLMKTNRLIRLEKDMSVIERYKNYLDKELSKLKFKESKVREKLRKEKEAIMLSMRAKRLRASKK